MAISPSEVGTPRYLAYPAAWLGDDQLRVLLESLNRVTQSTRAETYVLSRIDGETKRVYIAM